MTFAFVLGGNGRIKVLTQDNDALEAVLFGAMLLGLVYLFLQLHRGLVALLSLGEDEAQGDELVGIVELEEIVPVSLVEPGHRSQDQDVLAILDWRCGDGNIVEIVVCDGGWLERDARARIRFSVRRRRRREMVLGSDSFKSTSSG